MNDLSFLTTLGLVSLTLPGLAQIIQSIILGFIYMDMLQTDEWLNPMLFTKKELEDAKPLNKFFDENGFSSCIFIVNLGSTFIFFMLNAAILIITLIMKFLAYICGSHLGLI
jgi:hypothetical protein